VVVLDEATWAARQAAHHARVDEWIVPHLNRARRGEAHPVHDFLFTYYSHRPGRLRRWHPGHGTALRGDPPHRDWPGYRRGSDGVAVDPAVVTALARLIVESTRLLAAVVDRRPQFGCFGMHEWAMVYRSEQVRHPAWPLRLSRTDLADVVDSIPLRCTHYDAFRFFTPPARELNAITPTRSAMPEHEQGGCLHTNMDLYKAAYKLTPLIPAELVADCFELARQIRELDMRASPYDLSALGFPAVRVETAAGRAEYVAAQQQFAASAAALRGRLLELLEPLAARVQPACSSSPAMPATPSEIA
jgi:hypothetical protein